MKNITTTFLVISTTIFFILGCSKIDSLRQTPKTNDIKPDKNRTPITLNAKNIDNIAVPADAEIISDEKGNSSFEKRKIEIKIPAKVYDAANFFRTEMPKNGWKLSDRNNRKEDTDSILSFLDFTNEKEEVSLSISNGVDDKCEVEIRIRENPEYSRKKREAEADNKIETVLNGFPLPECADQFNRMMINGNLTLSGNCSENINTISKFFEEEAPKNSWIAKKQNDNSSNSKIMIFEKNNQKAVVTIMKENESSTSVSIQIPKG